MRSRGLRIVSVCALVVVYVLTLAVSAQAAVTVTRAEASAGRLRVKGTPTASRSITVDGVAMTTSSSTGSFKIDRSGFVPPADCTVDVNDGSATATVARLSGCTVSTPTPTPTPTPIPTPAPSATPAPVSIGARTLDALTLTPDLVQTGSTFSSATLFFSGPTPATDPVVALSSSNTAVASVPASVTVPRLSDTGAFSVAISSSAAGTATISSTYAGVTRTALLTASAQSLFRITTPATMPNARVGENYAGFIEACCGQGAPYTWSLVGGAVPAGLKFAGNALRLVQTTGVTGVATQV